MIDATFIVWCQAAAFIEPTEGALDDPALADELEALGIVLAAHDLQVQPAEGAQTFDPRH